jgi:hypothetical protein
VSALVPAANPQGVVRLLPRAEVLREFARLGVEERLTPEPNAGCLLWTGSASGGYGKVYLRLGGEKVIAFVHRVLWVVERWEIPPELTVDHLCFVGLCANVRHLELVPWTENLRRRRVAAEFYRRTYVEAA